jgi:hypothetical protein
MFATGQDCLSREESAHVQRRKFHVERDPAACMRCGWLLLVAAHVATASGCGGDDATRLGAYLGELEFNAPTEATASLSLGKFDVPAPAQIKSAGSEGSRTVWIRITFELFAEAAPEDIEAVEEAAEESRGALNDAVLTIIRTSSTDELTDPRLTALKLRMTEAARPLLGESRLRQLLLYDIDADVM